MKEKEYDDEIAPKLRSLAEQVSAAGGRLVFYVEFEGEDGEPVQGTFAVARDTTPSWQLTYMAAKSKGNLDALNLGLLRGHREGKLDLSQTITLKMFEGSTQ